MLPQFCRSDDYCKYLGKSFSLCGENEKQIEKFMKKYKTLVDQIKSSLLPIALV